MLPNNFCSRVSLALASSFIATEGAPQIFTTELNQLPSHSAYWGQQHRRQQGNLEEAAPDSYDNCTLCLDLSAVGLPDFVPGYPTDLQLWLIDGTVNEESTCLDIDHALQVQSSPQFGSTNSNAAVCSSPHRLLYAGLCGCPSVAAAPCELCPRQETLPNPDFVVQSLLAFGLPALTCQDFAPVLQQFNHDSYICFIGEYFAYLCGCENETSDFRFHGFWISRISGLVSLTASLLILVDIYWENHRRHQHRAMTIYQSLLSRMSLLDMVGSIGYALSTTPVPTMGLWGQPTAVYGASGTAATCTVQAFLVQFGLSGIWYNLSLSVYYVLVIRLGWQQKRIQKNARWLNLPVAIGIMLAFVGIPFYDFDGSTCHLPSPPLYHTKWLRVGMVTIPVLFVIAVITTNMVLVYLSVRKTQQALQEHASPTSQSDETMGTAAVTSSRALQIVSMDSEQDDEARIVVSSEPERQTVSMDNEAFETATAAAESSREVQIVGKDSENGDAATPTASSSREVQLVSIDSDHDESDSSLSAASREIQSVGVDNAPGDTGTTRSELASPRTGQQMHNRSRQAMSYRLQRAVLWQCFFYLASFYLTWPVLLTGQFLFSRDVRVPNWFWYINFAMVPLQGFWNFLVYARPRWQQYVKCRARRTTAQRPHRTLPTAMEVQCSTGGDSDRSFLMTHNNFEHENGAVILEDQNQAVDWGLSEH